MAERHLDLRVRDPLGRRDDHDLVGLVDREGRDRRGHAGAEVEEDDLVEARAGMPGARRRARRAICAITAGSGGAASRCKPLGRRETYGRSSPGERDAFLSRSKSTSDSGARARSGARSASVPKSGFRSTARTRRRRWLARTLPVRKVLVVLPQPPFGDRVATTFVRETPGRRRRLRLEVRLLAFAGGDGKARAAASRRRVSGCVGRGLAVDDRRVVEVVATGGRWGPATPAAVPRRPGSRHRRVEVGEPHGRAQIRSVWPGKDPGPGCRSRSAAG